MKHIRWSPSVRPLSLLVALGSEVVRNHGKDCDDGDLGGDNDGDLNGGGDEKAKDLIPILMRRCSLLLSNFIFISETELKRLVGQLEKTRNDLK